VIANQSRVFLPQQVDEIIIDIGVLYGGRGVHMAV
jgi:hypothetical protein